MHCGHRKVSARRVNLTPLAHWEEEEEEEEDFPLLQADANQ